MTSKRNLAFMIGVGVFGFIAGLALIFANQPFGRVLVMASAVGVAMALTNRRRPGD